MNRILVIIQLLVLGLLVVTPPAPRLPLPHRMAIGFGVVLVILGAGTLLVGTSSLRGNLSPSPQPRVNGQLVTRGIYKYMRHPLYSGVLLVALGWALGTAHSLRLLLVVFLWGILEMKARREESYLIKAYPDYADYRCRTKKFIPWVY